MPSWSLLTAFALAEAALIFFCVSRNAPRLEAELSRASTHALAERNVDIGEGFVLDGRDAWLTGQVSDAETKDRAERAVAGVNGIRVVHNLLAVVEEPVRAPSPEPQSSTVEAQRSIDSLMAGRSVEFETASDRLTQRGRALVGEIADLLGRFPEIRVEIAGHTDSEGPARNNLDLSRRRAEAVRARIIGSGIQPSRVTATGYGEDLPIADNETAAGRLKNRRVEVTVR